MKISLMFLMFKLRITLERLLNPVEKWNLPFKWPKTKKGVLIPLQTLRAKYSLENHTELSTFLDSLHIREKIQQYKTFIKEQSKIFFNFSISGGIPDRMMEHTGLWFTSMYELSTR